MQLGNGPAYCPECGREKLMHGLVIYQDDEVRFLPNEKIVACKDCGTEYEVFPLVSLLKEFPIRPEYRTKKLVRSL